MLQRIDESARRCRQILLEAEAGGDPAEAARRALAVWDEYPLAWLSLGMTLLGRDQPAEAAEALWQALRTAPTLMPCYLALKNALEETGDRATAWRLMILGLRCGGGEGQVMDVVAEHFSRLKESIPDLDFSDPSTYALMAEALEQDRPADVPLEVPESLVGYDVLMRLRIQASEEIEPDLLRQVRQKAAACVPVLHAALRYWWINPGSLGGDALAMVLALLGEFGGREVVSDLLSLCSSDDDQTFAHSNWGMWRLGQRLPAEVLAGVVEAAPEAGISLRCAFAEHLGLLPSAVNAEAALRGLLADFKPEPDAGYLVLAVSDALARRGHRAASRAVCKENLGKLDQEDRARTERTLRKGDFEAALVGKGIVGHTLDEVCLECILTNEEEEEEDKNDEEPQESGPRHEEMSRRERLQLDVLEASRSWQTKADAAMARELYLGSDADPEMTQEDAFKFFQWLMCDFRAPSSGKTAVEEYLRRRGHELTEEGRRQVETWRDSRYGMWEVLRVEEGKGVELRDFFGGEPFFVHDVTSSRELVQWDCLLTRIEALGGQPVFTGDGTLLPRTMLPPVLELIEEERRPEQTPSEFVRANSHRMWRVVEELSDDTPPPRLANTDGEEFEFSIATYEVRDEAALLAALRANASLDENEPGRAFAWTGQAGQGPSTLLGQMKIADGKLTLECNSRARLARGKKLVEEIAGASVRYLRDRFETVAQARARFEEMPAATNKAKIDPEVERELLAKLHERHYATWPDTPLPALGGATPRAAMATKGGRAQVEQLIRMFENGEARKSKSGLPAFDFSQLRAELGLPAK